MKVYPILATHNLILGDLHSFVFVSGFDLDLEYVQTPNTIWEDANMRVIGGLFAD